MKCVPNVWTSSEYLQYISNVLMFYAYMNEYRLC